MRKKKILKVCRKLVEGANMKCFSNDYIHIDSYNMTRDHVFKKNRVIEVRLHDQTQPRSFICFVVDGNKIKYYYDQDRLHSETKKLKLFVNDGLWEDYLFDLCS